MKRTNRDGTAAVAAAARAAGVGQLVHMSSIGAYSPGAGQRVDESWPTDGVRTSDYSVDKVAAEQIVRGYEGDLPMAVARPTFILQDAAASEIHRYFLGPLVPRQVIRPAVMGRAPVPVAARPPARAHRRRCRRAWPASSSSAPQERSTSLRILSITRERWRELYGHVGPDLSPAVLRRAAAADVPAAVAPDRAQLAGSRLRAADPDLRSPARARLVGDAARHAGVDRLRRRTHARRRTARSAAVPAGPQSARPGGRSAPRARGPLRYGPRPSTGVRRRSGRGRRPATALRCRCRRQRCRAGRSLGHGAASL